MRGKQLVIAGDRFQLPPTTFFDRSDSDAGDDTEEEVLTTGVESIGQYGKPELVEVIWWIRSDGQLRTEDQLLEEWMDFLGFQRRGKNIFAAACPLAVDFRVRLSVRFA